MSSEEHLREEPWGIDEPNKLLWRCATLRSSDSVLSRLRPKTWVLGMKPERPCRTHFRTCPQGEEVFTQIASDVWHLHDDCDEIYDSGHEVRVLRPCAMCNRQNLQEVDADPVRHFDGQGMRAVDAPPGMEFD